MRFDVRDQSSAPRDVQRATEGCHPRQGQHVTESEMEDDLVLYNPTRDTAHILNKTAAAVWWLCDGEQAPEDICAELANLYGMEPAAVRPDVEEVLAGFREAGLVRCSGVQARMSS